MPLDPPDCDTVTVRDMMVEKVAQKRKVKNKEGYGQLDLFGKNLIVEKHQKKDELNDKANDEFNYPLRMLYRY